MCEIVEIIMTMRPPNPLSFTCGFSKAREKNLAISIQSIPCSFRRQNDIKLMVIDITQTPAPRRDWDVSADSANLLIAFDVQACVNCVNLTSKNCVYSLTHSQVR